MENYENISLSHNNLCWFVTHKTNKTLLLIIIIIIILNILSGKEHFTTDFFSGLVKTWNVTFRAETKLLFKIPGIQKTCTDFSLTNTTSWWLMSLPLIRTGYGCERRCVSRQQFKHPQLGCWSKMKSLKPNNYCWNLCCSWQQSCARTAGRLAFS